MGLKLFCVFTTAVSNILTEAEQWASWNIWHLDSTLQHRFTPNVAVWDWHNTKCLTTGCWNGLCHIWIYFSHLNVYCRIEVKRDWWVPHPPRRDCVISCNILVRLTVFVHIVLSLPFVCWAGTCVHLPEISAFSMVLHLTEEEDKILCRQHLAEWRVWEVIRSMYSTPPSHPSLMHLQKQHFARLRLGFSSWVE